VGRGGIGQRINYVNPQDLHMPFPISSTRAAWIARGVLGCLFLYAGLRKLAAPEDLTHSIAALGWLPDSWINPLALALPVFEIMCGLCVMIPYRRASRAGALGLTLLLVLFLGVWIYVAVTGKAFSCSCFGSDSFLNFGGTVGAILRNAMLLAAAAWIYGGEATIAPPNQVSTTA
jgi:uncharacterized membrane protein YphA (DoxX/SURF4 family)